MQYLAIPFIILAGILNSVQTGANTTVERTIGSVGISLAIIGFVTFLTGAVAAIGGQALADERMPRIADLASLPWWAWLGGAMGAFYVASMLLFASQVGAAVFMALSVTAAVITSLVMDHFGLLGFEVKPANIGRIVGATAMIGGVALIAKS
ncbi:EamA-like transporter family protein [Erythrobacter litoralis]|uniref:DMT family transporter n=1 Tax=Erythrobacter litoralis TaxID=39960 RepID=UPI0024354C95|nr:DMT family transporter [Erythrobacter litoralis]MDG6080253.1 EamA-like transporter family protein [Erythrobacter litoralis]